MKTRILASAILLAAIGLCAQGTVMFVNNASTLVTLDDSLVPAGTTFSINLYYHEDSDTVPADNAFVALGNPVNFIADGRFNGGIRTTPISTRPGQAAWFHVRLWETAFGSSYEQAAMSPLSRVAVSDKFKLVVDSPIGTPTLITSLSGFTSIQLVPEPSVMALTTLGLIGLFVLRRQRVSKVSSLMVRTRKRGNVP